MCSQWSLLWWLLKGEPISWFSCHSIVIRFEETQSPAQKCFLSHCMLVWKGIWSLFCNCYCTYTDTHTHTHARTYVCTCTHTHMHKHIHTSKWYIQCLLKQFLFPGEFWREGHLPIQIIFSVKRPGNWERVWKAVEARKKRALNWKNNCPRGTWAQWLDPPVITGGQEHCLYQSVYQINPWKHIHTSIHQYIHGLGWAGQ